ncbi:MAG: RNA 2',3'-cyclic phosphodiesterase [Patescibacteria group bacterium]|jgi:2'-5' RNA ligase
MKKRVFIAIDLPEILKQEIKKLQIKLQKFSWPVRWEEKEKLHLTLRFLGLIDEHQISSISRIVKEAVAKSESFQLSVDGFIAYPNLRFPSVICLLIEDSKTLYSLQGEIDSTIEKQNIGEKERHPFSAHITIGRVGKINTNFHALNKIEFKSKFDVQSMEIMESKLDNEGSKYFILKSFKL